MSAIAVIVPTWNNARELARCLHALDAQTLRDFNVTIVDDGSTPPLNVECRMSNVECRVIRQAHAGAPAARNRGARETQSEFLLFCDADVELKPRALDQMLQALRAHPEASYAYSAFRFGWKTFRSFPFDPQRLRRMPYIHTTSLMRRAHFPGFDESLKRFQDWDLWLTMFDQGHVGLHIPEVLFTVRSGGTMSRWFPSFALRLPWKPQRVRAYEDAATIIRKKHRLVPTADP
jgi:glycosyltransferase involved in cell wall biosynthesis